MFPYKTDVQLNANPISNIILILFTIIIFFISNLNDTIYQLFILHRYNLLGLVGYTFLHADIIHLMGNMWMLWIFGNAICSRYGNYNYLILYVIVGIIGGVFHLAVSSNPVIGASGSVNGVLGAFLILYPKNKVHVYFWGALLKIPSIALILIWFVYDVFGAVSNNDNIAYMTHIGGLIGGVIVTPLFSNLGKISYENPDNFLSYTIRSLQRNKMSQVIYKKSDNNQYFIVYCPSCAQPMKANEKFISKIVKCPNCNDFFLLR